MYHLTTEEIKRLLREIPNNRQRLMFKVGFLHGLRVSELISLTRENIRDGYVAVQRLKGSLKTIQPYVSNADPELDEAAELKVLYTELKPGEKLFPWTRNWPYKLMQEAGEKAGLPAHKCHPHVLKHSCAMIGINTMGIHLVRQYLGHKSISSTGEYLKETDEAASIAFAGAIK